jgi:hypothetical protein
MSRRAPDRDAVVAPGAVLRDLATQPGHFRREATMPRHRDVIINIGNLEQLSRAKLRALWTEELAEEPPPALGRDILALGIAYARQQRRYGGLSRPVAKELDRLLARALGDGSTEKPLLPTRPLPRAGTILVREWQGKAHHVTVTDDGFLWNGKPHRSLSSVARAITGTTWNGPRFFGLREVETKTSEVRNGS